MKKEGFTGFTLLDEGFDQKWQGIGQGGGGFLRIFLGFIKVLSEKQGLREGGDCSVSKGFLEEGIFIEKGRDKDCLKSLFERKLVRLRMGRAQGGVSEGKQRFSGGNGGRAGSAGRTRFFGKMGVLQIKKGGRNGKKGTENNFNNIISQRALPMLVIKLHHQ